MKDPAPQTIAGRWGGRCISKYQEDKGGIELISLEIPEERIMSAGVSVPLKDSAVESVEREVTIDARY